MLKNYSRDTFFTSIITASFFLQYNPYFSYKFLWIQYWDGLAYRVASSLLGIFLAICTLFWNRDLYNIRCPNHSIVLFFFFLYGTLIGLFSDHNLKTILGDGLLFFELSIYGFLFYNTPHRVLLRTLRLLLLISPVVCSITLLLFLITYKSVVVNAYFGGVIVSRLTDFIAPLLLICTGTIPVFRNRFATYYSIAIYFVIILLGFFRSSWLSLIFAISCSFVLTAQSCPKRTIINFLKSIIAVIAISSLVTSIMFGSANLVFSRIMAGIGTPDSIGRVTSALAVLQQSFTSWPSTLLGHGYGYTAYYVNDFGQGPILALQPIGSISNFYVIILAEFGLLGFTILSFFFIKSFITVLFDSRLLMSKSLLTTLIIYLAVQYLTFPSASHFPVVLLTSLVWSIWESNNNPSVTKPNHI